MKVNKIKKNLSNYSIYFTLLVLSKQTNILGMVFYRIVGGFAKNDNLSQVWKCYTTIYYFIFNKIQKPLQAITNQSNYFRRYSKLLWQNTEPIILKNWDTSIPFFDSTAFCLCNPLQPCKMGFEIIFFSSSDISCRLHTLSNAWSTRQLIKNWGSPSFHWGIQ